MRTARGEDEDESGGGGVGDVATLTYRDVLDQLFSRLALIRHSVLIDKTAGRVIISRPLHSSSSFLALFIHKFANFLKSNLKISKNKSDSFTFFSIYFPGQVVPVEFSCRFPSPIHLSVDPVHFWAHQSSIWATKRTPFCIRMKMIFKFYYFSIMATIRMTGPGTGGPEGNSDTDGFPNKQQEQRQQLQSDDEWHLTE